MIPVNWNRVILGGVAGAVVNVCEYLINGVRLAQRWANALWALKHPAAFTSTEDAAFSFWGFLMHRRPCYAVITTGKVHEIRVACKLQWQPGTMLVFDRGYTDYDWFQRLAEEGVHFVTRLKDNASYLVIEERKSVGVGVRSDEVIVLNKQAALEEAPFLRRVQYWDEDNQRELVFLTNHLELEAKIVLPSTRSAGRSRCCFRRAISRILHVYRRMTRDPDGGPIQAKAIPM